MSTQPKQNLYRIFLLTVWQEDQETWRFLLEDPRSGERKGFAGLDSLVDGLQSVMNGNAPPSDESASSDSAQSPGC